MSNADKASLAIRAVISFAIILITAWLVYRVVQTFEIPPLQDSQGNIILDQYARANALLLVVLPLLTTAFGYWFGAQGTAKAEKKAETESKKLEAVLSEAPEGILERARTAYPGAFG